MQYRKRFLGGIIAGLILVISTTSIWLAFPSPASAQCGSQASSCKNCHEVQGEKPVNNDGTAWHPSHAFGDFCYICHAGNNQAKDEAAAHEGMVEPLSDIKASCQQCHVADLDARAQVYASALGIEIGAGGSTTQGSNALSTVEKVDQVSTPASASVPGTGNLYVDDPNALDYIQRYDEIVLGKKSANWGNLILIGLIGLVTVGGGGFVLYNEGWVNITTEPIKPIPDGLPEDIIEMLPKIEKLTKKGRRGLQSMLKDPESADELLDVIARHTHKGD
jgi:hypothetical protein